MAGVTRDRQQDVSMPEASGSATGDFCSLFPILRTLPLSGRRGAWGGEAES